MTTNENEWQWLIISHKYLYYINMTFIMPRQFDCTKTYLFISWQSWQGRNVDPSPGRRLQECQRRIYAQTKSTVDVKWWWQMTWASEIFRNLRNIEQFVMSQDIATTNLPNKKIEANYKLHDSPQPTEFETFWFAWKHSVFRFNHSRAAYKPSAIWFGFPV